MGGIKKSAQNFVPSYHKPNLFAINYELSEIYIKEPNIFIKGQTFDVTTFRTFEMGDI